MYVSSAQIIEFISDLLFPLALALGPLGAMMLFAASLFLFGALSVHKLLSRPVDRLYIELCLPESGMRRQVLATHCRTGDTVWFNHAHMFHVSNIPEHVRAALLQEFAEDELPRNAFYGDGSRIPDDHMEAIRTLYRESALYFAWREGDVLLLDNFLTTHGRSPFVGKRRITVAMAELYTNPEQH